MSFEEVAALEPLTPEEMWKIVRQSSDAKQISVKPTANRKGWKTIRLFVSSTFKDFHQEREVLVKEVCIRQIYDEWCFEFVSSFKSIDVGNECYRVIFTVIFFSFFKVFPDLRLWCEARKLRLVECDLRWVIIINLIRFESFYLCYQTFSNI